jgi:hypothetical protein
MARYLALWEVERGKIAVDRRERGSGWAELMALVRQHTELGLFQSWGAFVGQESGYIVCEGDEVDVMNALQQYVPFVRFKLQPLATEEQVNRMIEGLSKAGS